MGFFNIGKAATKKISVQGISLSLLHSAGCQVCPLNHCPGNKHPHMPAAGSERPLIYMLGEAPGANEDKRGKPFVGDAGQVLRYRIPKDWLPDIRWNNTVRTRPPDNRDPTPVEVECCRPSIIKDIEETQPAAIFGFGNVPLQWAIRRPAITVWRGRRVPVRIGKHACWYYPMIHPSSILHQASMRDKTWRPRSEDDYVVDDEFAFALDLKRAFAEVDHGLPNPEDWLLTAEEVQADTDFVTGHGGQADVNRVLDFIEQCWDQEASGLDYETNCLRPYKEGAKILTAGLAHRKQAFAFALKHEGAGWSPEEFKQVNTAFGDFLHDAPTKKVSFALPFEMEWSAWFYGNGCLWGSEWEDAQSQAYILDERGGKDDNARYSERGGLALDFLCMQYYGFDLKAISNLDRKKLAETPVEEVLPYNALDAKAHLMLYFDQRDRLEEEGLEEVYREQLRRAPTVVLSQIQGVPIDQEEARAFADLFEDKKAAAEDKIDAHPDAISFRKKYGEHYSPSKAKHVKKLFNNIIGAHLEDATSEAALNEIDHPLAGLSIEWRKAAKALSTYIYPTLIDSENSNIYPDQLLHFILSICKVRTWRTSSEEPNVQNWPKRNEELKEIRRLITVLRDSYIEKMLGLGSDLYVCSIDYAGIQARNIAMESGDEALIEAFWHRYDIHTDWLKRIQRIYPRWCDIERIETDKTYKKKYRYLAKNGFVFPSFFGAMPRKTAGELDVPEWVTEEARKEFFSKDAGFPDVLTWQEELKADYYKLGYVTGLSGFRRRAPVEVNQIINSPIQADESIIVLDAMARLSKMAHEEDKPQYQAMLEIHDDLTFLWPKKDIERNAIVVIGEMLKVPYEWAKVVPIEVELSIGKNWADLQEVGAFASDTWKGELNDEQRKKLPR